MHQNFQWPNKSVAKQTSISGPIPRKAAISSDIRDFEQKRIVFTFKYYNHAQCEIHGLEKQDAKKLIMEFRKVNDVSVSNFQSNRAGIKCKKVFKSGNYVPLFNNLPVDVDALFEINYTDTGRIFGYLAENIFNIPE